MKAAFRTIVIALIAILISGIHSGGSTSLPVSYTGDLFRPVHYDIAQLPAGMGFNSTPEFPFKLKAAIRTKALQSDSNWFVASQVSFPSVFIVSYVNKVYNISILERVFTDAENVLQLRGPPAPLFV